MIGQRENYTLILKKIIEYSTEIDLMLDFDIFKLLISKFILKN